MAKAVWKIVLESFAREHVHQLPFGARPLHVDRDTREPEKVAVWFEVEATAPLIGHVLHRIGTGSAVPPGVRYIGSVVIEHYAWHVFHGAPSRTLGIGEG